MIVKVGKAVAALKKHRKWLTEQTRDDFYKKRNAESAEDVLVWCLDYFDYSPVVRDRWRNHRSYRSFLWDRPEKCCFSAEGRKAVDELLALVISKLEADEPFCSEVEVDLLPGIRKQRRLSPEHSAVLQKGAATARGKRGKVSPRMSN